MPNQLYRNLGNGRFEDVSARAGAVFSAGDVGRGAAFGDIDNDGDTDVVVGNAAGRRGCSSTTSATATTGWGCGCSEAATPRDMLGARVEVIRDERPPLLAPRAIRRQLRVGQRSACARRPRHGD